MRDYLRMGVLSLAALAFATTMTACGDDDDINAPVTTDPATATQQNTTPVTSTATTGSTSTQIPTATVPATGPSGNASIDGIIAAVELGNSSLLAGLVEYQTIECTTAQGAGGPPKCATGEAEGTPVRVFPVRTCELEFIRDRDMVGFLDIMLLSESPEVHSAVEITEEALSEMFPTGDYGIIFDTPSGGRLVGVNEAGMMVTLVTDCGATADELLDSQEGGEVLIEPGS